MLQQLTVIEMVLGTTLYGYQLNVSQVPVPGFARLV